MMASYRPCIRGRTALVLILLILAILGWVSPCDEYKCEQERPMPTEPTKSQAEIRGEQMRRDAETRKTAAQQISNHYRARELQNHDMLRKLATRGQLEAFVALERLDHERDPAKFDEAVARAAPAWLARNVSGVRNGN